MERLTFRLTPGADLLVGIRKKVEEQRIEAGYMITCAGSVSQAVIRFADQEHEEQLPGPFEILSLSGTVSIHGSHLHVGLADSSGKAVGGHLMEGCRVYTTAEIVLGVDSGRIYRRELCPDSGYQELVVENRPS